MHWMQGVRMRSWVFEAYSGSGWAQAGGNLKGISRGPSRRCVAECAGNRVRISVGL
jgi:hypothetical protein